MKKYCWLKPCKLDVYNYSSKLDNQVITYIIQAYFTI